MMLVKLQRWRSGRKFNRSALIDFKGAKLASDTGVLMLREVDERFGSIGPMANSIDDCGTDREFKSSTLFIPMARAVIGLVSLRPALAEINRLIQPEEFEDRQ